MLCAIVTWINATDLPDDPPPQQEIDEVVENLRRRARARFYADENFPSLAIRWLKARKLDVVSAAELGRCGHPDEAHVSEALRLRRILLTCDRDFLDDRRFPIIHCPALVVFDFGEGDMHDVGRALRCLAPMVRAPQFYDKWCKIHALH
jgi:predicted nuclease of predicted toxin-antitoxin system